jgi:hypothetical protein
MNKVNYSLLAALVNEPKANLYDDIVYPIVGYSLSSLAESQQSSEHHYCMTDVQDYIKKEVGIEIPISLVRPALLSASQKNKDVEIGFVDQKHHYFLIKRAWDTNRHSRVSVKAQSLQTKKAELETLYQSYLESNGYASEVTLEDFLTQNMEEALDYMRGKEETYINEKYIHVARFLVNMRVSGPDLYDVISDIAWGVMVAGLLQEESLPVLQEKRGRAVVYYLDTPIVMAAIDLSRESNVAQARDLIRTIQALGGIIRVHPLTLEEINRILYSVIQNRGVYRSNELAEAYYRRNLRLTDIVFLKEDLEGHIKKAGMSILELANSQVEKMKDSCDKSLIKELAESRGSDQEDDFREIHDICLWKYVSTHTGGRNTKELDAYLVTSNRDLIRMTKEHLDASYKDCLIRPDNVILNLWLRGGLRSEMKKELLSAKMTQCFVANDVDTAKRLDAVLQLPGKDMTSEEQASLKGALADRQPTLIQLTDKAYEELDEETGYALRARIMTESNEQKKRSEKLAEERLRAEQEKYAEQIRAEANAEMKRLEEDVKQRLQSEQEKYKEEMNRIINQHAQREEMISQQKELHKRIVECKLEIAKLEAERDATIHPWLRFLTFPLITRWVVVVVIGIVCFCIIHLISSSKQERGKVLDIICKLLGGGVILTLIGTVIKFIFKPGKAKVYLSGLTATPKDEYVKIKRLKWEKKSERYAKLIGELEKLKVEDEGLEKQLANTPSLHELSAPSALEDNKS